MQWGPHTSKRLQRFGSSWPSSQLRKALATPKDPNLFERAPCPSGQRPRRAQEARLQALSPTRGSLGRVEWQWGAWDWGPECVAGAGPGVLHTRTGIQATQGHKRASQASTAGWEGEPFQMWGAGPLVPERSVPQGRPQGPFLPRDLTKH